MFWLGPQDTVDRSATDADLPMSVEFMPSVASLPTSSDFSNAVGLRPKQGSAREASTAVLKNETRARPKSAAWRERQLIPQQQAVSKVWLMTGIGCERRSIRRFSGRMIPPARSGVPAGTMDWVRPHFRFVVLGASLATPPYEIGPAPSFYDTIRQQPSADLVQKHDPGSGYGAKKGLTAEGPAESSSMREKGKRPWYPEPAHSSRSI